MMIHFKNSISAKISKTGNISWSGNWHSRILASNIGQGWGTKSTMIQMFRFCIMHNTDFSLLFSPLTVSNGGEKKIPRQKNIVEKFAPPQSYPYGKHTEWKAHIEQIIQKMSSNYYGIRFVYHFSKTDTLNMIYFAYFHSFIKYGIKCWGNSNS